MLLERINQSKNAAKIVFIHCCQDKGHHVMREELRMLSEKTGFAYHVAYERGDDADHIGYLNTAVLGQWLSGNPDRDIFFCGPTPFMAALHILLSRLGYAEEQLHYEIFGPRIRFSETY